MCPTCSARHDAAAASSGCTWWIPTRQTVDDAREVLGIHPVAAADVASGRQQPKVQMFEGHLFVLLWSVLEDTESDELLLGQTYLYIGDEWLLTVQRANGGNLPDLRGLLEDGPADLHDGPIAAAYTIMADVVDGYAKAAADVEAHLQELEEQVFNEGTNEDHRRIYKVRKDMGRIDRAVSSIAAALRESTGPPRDDEARQGAHRAVPPRPPRRRRRHRRVDQQPSRRRSTPSSRAMRTMSPPGRTRTCARSPRSLRFSPLPTLIAGLYGMNFKNLPLVQWEFGWIVMGGAIVIIDVIIYIMFKRRGWL